VTVVNAEKAIVSGRRGFILTSRKRFLEVGSFRKGPHHPRRPDTIVRRTVRGMLPWRNPRGREAYRRLKVHIGVPDELRGVTGQGIPEADASRLRCRSLTVGEIAQEIGVHESTVGRVVANKYLITPRGVFSMKYFFHKALHGDLGEDISSLRIKERLRKLVGSEDKNNPLSDKEIEEILARENFKIARRTVAKYRKQLNIQPSHIRKRKFIMEGTS